MDYFDLHTHRIVVSQRAIVDISLENADAMIKRYPAHFFSVGIHPMSQYEDIDKALEQLREVSTSPSVVAIGEAGLDKRSSLSMEEQLRIFIQVVALSERVEKPLVIHCVRAFGEILALKKRLNPRQPWIVHGFRKSARLAQQLVEAGFYISFGEKLSVGALQEVPLCNLFIETDKSDCSVDEIYRSVSEQRNISLEELRSVMLENARKVFAVL